MPIRRVFASFLLLAAFSVASRAADAPAYKVSSLGTIGGEGGWDYVTIDDKGETLYIPRSTHTLVIEAATGKTLADIKSGKRPTAHFVQLYWLLTSFFSACAEVGAAGYVICQP